MALMLIDARREPPPEPAPEPRRRWSAGDHDLRLWLLLALTVALPVLASGVDHGLIGYLLVLGAFWTGMLSVDRALPYRRGLGEHRQ